MNDQSDVKVDVIREFCRSHNAPTADWLGRLSTNGQRECVRQWILRIMSPEIRGQLPAVAEALCAQAQRPGLAEEMYEQGIGQAVRRGDFPAGVSAESREEYCVTFEAAGRHFANRQLDEELRYGAIEFGDVDAPKLSLKNKQYRKYRALCDQEWERMVEGKQIARDNFHRATLVTLLLTASALLLTTVRIAMWCAVIGAIVTTILVWPRRGRNRIADEGFRGFMRAFRENK